MMKKLLLVYLTVLAFQSARAQPAQASFTTQDQCDGVSFVFTNTSTVSPGDSIIQNVWFAPSSFGDDTLSTDKNYGDYFSKGVHIIGLTIRTKNGAASTQMDTFTVYTDFGLDFYYFYYCDDADSTVMVSLNGYNNDTWNFGDGDSATGDTAFHKYKSPGTYWVTLTSTTPNGCRTTKQKYVTIYHRVNTQFHYTLKGHALSADADSANLKYYYWWPDYLNNAMAGTSDPHYEWTYQQDGEYIIRFEAGNDYGCGSVFMDTIQVKTESISPEQQSAAGLRIYPNPFRQIAEVEYTLTEPSAVKIGLYAMDGRQVFVLQEGTQAAGKQSIRMSSQSVSLKPGVYFLSFQVNGATAYRKLVKVE